MHVKRQDEIYHIKINSESLYIVEDFSNQHKNWTLIKGKGAFLNLFSNFYRKISL